ncbi:MAG TPA: DUF3592 domain-containing protein [Acidimicrobiales bacterium]|nr:DUF3592 domain-containing protein [Acidimicrobiales bacterium]
MSLPGPVRAHAARPLLLVLAGAILAAAVMLVGAADARQDRRRAATALRVEGEVTGGSRRGDQIPVSYRNPVTGQEIEVAVHPAGAALLPGGDAPDLRPGDRVDLEVAPDDPDAVRLAGDRLPWFHPAAVLPFLVVPLMFWLLRRWSLRRTVRLVRSDGTSFAMLGAIAPSRPFHRAPVLHLYPLDAPAGAPPTCAVRVLTTAGCPVAGPAFPVEVKGVPRPLGRVAARAGPGDGVLWPAARAALHGAWPRPAAVVDPVPPAPAPEAALPAWLGSGEPFPQRTGASSVLRPALVAVAVTLVLGVGVTTVTLANAAAARRDVARRLEAVGEVVDRDGGAFTVDVRYTGTDGRERTATAGVATPGDYTVGRRYPLLVDPVDPRDVVLGRERYDRAFPIVIGWLPAAAAVLDAAARARVWRRSRRVARTGPWSQADVWAGADGSLLFGDRRRGYLRAGLLHHPVDAWLRRRSGRDEPPGAAPLVPDAARVVLAGTVEPGGVVAVIDGEGGVYVVPRRLGVPGGPGGPATAGSAGSLRDRVRERVAWAKSRSRLFG